MQEPTATDEKAHLKGVLTIEIGYTVGTEIGLSYDAVPGLPASMLSTIELFFDNLFMRTISHSTPFGSEGVRSTRCE